MSYHHLTTFERGSIEALYREGHSLREIAARTGRSPSTISRELRRCPERYSAKLAEWQYRRLRQDSRPKGKATPQLLTLLEQHLARTWSPEQIAHTVAKGQVSTKTIYNWLYAGKLGGGDLRLLRQKGKRRNPHNKRGYYTVGRSIKLRPPEVQSRQTFGHWELDTVWSCQGARASLATFVERKTRLYTAVKLPDKSADSMEQAIEQLLSVLPAGAFKTGTCDRGKEFGCHARIEARHEDVKLYFCHAYRAWERGSNENCNGLLREFFPKGTDFADVTQEELAHALLLINSRPRKRLNWQSPIHLFLHQVFHLT